MTDNEPSAAGPLVSALLTLQELLLDMPEMASLATSTALLVTSLLPMHVGCALSLPAGFEADWIGGSGAGFTQLRQLETERGDGPSLDAGERGVAIVIRDVEVERRWTALCAQLRQQGIGSLLALPMQSSTQTVAVATLYVPAHVQLVEEEVRDVLVLGRAAAATLVVRQRVEEQARLNEQLRQSAATRPVIDQALGIVMARRGCSASEAFDALRVDSQAVNQPVREIAAGLVAATTGRSPEPPRPFVDRTAPGRQT